MTRIVWTRVDTLKVGDRLAAIVPPRQYVAQHLVDLYADKLLAEREADGSCALVVDVGNPADFQPAIVVQIGSTRLRRAYREHVILPVLTED